MEKIKKKLKVNIKFGSVCSGIEAASVAWNPLGFNASWLSEIERFPAELLAYRYPDVPNIGDMLKAPSMVRNGKITAPDILVGGTPCQSFSAAGMRKGLSDERGQLTMSFVDLANEIDKQRVKNGKQESIIVWENVPGVLSSKDNAFGCFLGALAGESCELQPAGRRWTNAGYILGPQRAIAWRILDAQYFGLAQRRRRVFVIASARAGFCPAKVLFEFEGVRRDTPPSRNARQGVAATTERGAVSSGSYGDVVGALCARDYKGVGNQYVSEGKLVVSESIRFRKLTFESYAQDEIASTMMARDYKSYTDLVAYGIPGNWIGRKPENGGNSTQFMHEVAPAQTATDKHGVIAFNSRQDPVSGDVFGALDTCSPQAQAAAYGCTPTKLNDVVNTITASYGQGGVDLETKPLALVTAIADDVTPKTSEELGFTLSATDYKCPQAVHSTSIRRLTPVECERLQGFPDFYTMIPWRNKPAEDCPDGHRYKALGNSMAVPVMRWIGERILKELKNEL